MRKLKLLLATLALVGGSNVVNASVTLETDLTSQFSALTNYQNWTGATGYTATNFCPMVVVNGLGQKQVCEKYEGNCNSTGDIFYQTVTGLTAGTYTIELYGGAAYTFGRGFSSEAFAEGTWNAGDKIEENTGVELYATTSEGNYGGEIPIYYATNFPDGAATVKIQNVIVGSNGELKIGMSKTSKSTNWHVIQLKSVIATVDGDETIASLKAKANALLANATYANVTGSERTNLVAAVNATPAEETVEAYQAVISALNNAIAAFETVDYAAYDAFVAEKAKALALGLAEADANPGDAVDAADAKAKTQTIMVAEYTYVSTNFPNGVELGTWTTTGETATNKGQHWDGTDTSTYLEQLNRGGDNPAGWNASSWSIGYSQDVLLPAGKYVFKVAGRRSSNDVDLVLTVKNGETTLGTVNDFPKGDVGKGIDTNGATNYAADGTYANSNNGRGWEWRYVRFELSEPATVNVAVTADAKKMYQWVSFCNATVQTDSEDNVALMEALVALNDAKTSANLTKVTSNIGTGVFQYNEEVNNSLYSAYETAKTNVDNYTLSSSSTVEEINGLITTLETAISDYQNQALNAPVVGTRYYIKVATEGHEKLGNAVVINLGSTSNNNPTGYGFSANSQPNPNMAQAFIFTHKEGNIYYISTIRPEGEVFLTYGTNNESAAGWKDSQIQATIDATKKGEFKIAATTTDNVFNIYNTLTNSTIACQAGGNIYTEAGNADFSVAEASQASVNLTITADVKYATRIFPFVPELPSGVVAYACEAATEKSLTLTEVTTPEADTPYILIAENGCASTNLTGWGVAGAVTKTVGYLTGVYTAQKAPVGSYVLQNNNGNVAFYVVAEGENNQPTVGANRVYVTVPASGVRSLDLGGEETGIAAIEALTSGKAEIFNASGAQIPALQKGVNIIRKADGTTYKIMVK